MKEVLNIKKECIYFFESTRRSKTFFVNLPYYIFRNIIKFIYIYLFTSIFIFIISFNKTVVWAFKNFIFI